MRYLVRIIAMLAVGLAALWTWPTSMNAQSPNKAALVIRYSEEDVQSVCVSFDEPQISGFDLLVRAGLDLAVDVQGAGSLVCSINNNGCPVNDCWCQCKGGGDCIYWSYWHQQGGDWIYSQAGASIYKIENGSIDGWSWGPGSVFEAFPPPDISFKEVCLSEPTLTPTTTPTPSNTPPPLILSPLPSTTVRPPATETRPLPSSTPTHTPDATVKPSSPTAVLSPTRELEVTNVVTIESPPTKALNTPEQLGNSVDIQAQNPTETNEPLPTPPSGDVITNKNSTPTMLPTSTPVAVAQISADMQPPTMVSVAVKDVPAEKIEPVIQRTVVGSGYSSEPKQTNVVDSENGINQPSDKFLTWFPYFGFLVIIFGLVLLLFRVKRRRNL